MLKFAVLVLSAAASGFAQKTLMLPAGTPVRLGLADSVSSATGSLGDRVTMRVLESVRVEGIEVIPAGTAVIATVSGVERHSAGAKGGKIEFKPSPVTLASGTRIPLSSRAEQRPPAAVMTAGAIPTTVTFEQGGPFRAAATGTDAVIAGGSEIAAYIAADTLFEATKLPGAAATATALTNAAVIAMWRSGQSEVSVIASIKSAPANYRLDAAGIAELKRAGLTSAVIEAMMAVARGK